MPGDTTACPHPLAHAAGFRYAYVWCGLPTLQCVVSFVIMRCLTATWISPATVLVHDDATDNDNAETENVETDNDTGEPS